ncbi:hypothetical protein LSAT2_002258 [Lamellibrachia satsuma]|nr:hypothetical protein LSAT2_002258 [Lamellibrachia satsuma]
MWIDAGRTCDTEGGNRKIDWDKGLVTVKVCHSARVCHPNKINGKTKRALREIINSGVAEYAVAITDNKVANSPPVIESEDIHIRRHSTAPAPRGDVTLSIDDKLSYSTYTNCYGEDTIHFTVWEKRTDDVVSPLSVDGTLIVEIRGSNDVPILHMSKEGRDIVPPSSVVTVTVEENSGNNAAYKDLIFILAAHDVDDTDDINVAFEQPKHGNLTLYRQVKTVELIQQNCSISWNARRHLWDKLVNDITASTTIQKVSLPNPFDTDFVNLHFAWVILVFKYAPFEQYFGEDTIEVMAADLTSQELLIIDVKVLRSPCINRRFCKGSESDPECKLTNRSTGFDGYTCRCPRGYRGDYCETDVDKCLSSPCQTNYMCIDRVDSYEL